MKHFVGGYALAAAVSFLVMATTADDTGKSGEAEAIFGLAFTLFGLLGGIAAWGLLP